jgi:hypothetical protein
VDSGSTVTQRLLTRRDLMSSKIVFEPGAVHTKVGEGVSGREVLAAFGHCDREWGRGQVYVGRLA